MKKILNVSSCFIIFLVFFNSVFVTFAAQNHTYTFTGNEIENIYNLREIQNDLLTGDESVPLYILENESINYAKLLDFYFEFDHDIDAIQLDNNIELLNFVDNNMTIGDLFVISSYTNDMYNFVKNNDISNCTYIYKSDSTNLIAFRKDL